MGFSRQEYWSELPFPAPGDLPDTEIKPAFYPSPALAVDSLPLGHLGRAGDFFLKEEKLSELWVLKLFVG